MTNGDITKDQIKQIASLAKLELSDDELDKFTKEFKSIIDYVSMVKDFKVESPDNSHNLKNYKGTAYREDKAQKSQISKEKLLQNATEGRQKAGYIRVSKIIDKSE